MVRHAGSQEGPKSARLIYLAGALLALAAIVPACSCEDKPTITVTVPDVGLDVTPPDPDVVDEDVPEPDPEDVADVPDVLDDVEDVDVEDEGGEEDADAGLDRFGDSCLFEVLDCLGNDPEAVSCTVNTNTGQTAVSYGNETAARWERGEDDRVFFEAFTEEELCYSAQALDAREVPFGWEIADGDDNYTVARDEDSPTEIVVTCPDNTEERYFVDEVQPYLPVILAEDDPLCQPLGTPQCEEDPDCEILGNGFECCGVAGLTRCLVESQCPAIPDDAPELDSCLTEMLDCFGLRHVPLTCNIDPNIGVTDIAYTRDRRAVITTDGFDNYTVETGAEGVLCYLAEMSGDRPYESVSFDDPNSEDVFGVEFLQGRARVTCADGTEEVHDEDAIMQYIPIFLTETDDICEVEPINECGGNDDCGGDELCCGTLEGNQCLNVMACPEVVDPWDTSCMRPLMDCFGPRNNLSICVDHGDLDITEVAYASGARATYFLDRGQEVRRTFFENDACFEAVTTETPDGFEVTDLVNGEVYVVEFNGENANITCPDNSNEIITREDIDEYMLPRPSALQCNEPIRPDVCLGDNDCGDGQECCNVGDRNLCLVEGDCADAQPRTACEGQGDCGQGDLCCVLEAVRVCNPRLCGRDQICCDLPQQQVCAPDAVCNRVDDCAPDDPDACDEGQLCCPTEGGRRCLDLDVCPDLNDPWGTSCLFGTFECQGSDLELDACTFDENLDVTEVDYTSGARVTYYNTLLQPGRRATNGGQPCFNLIESDEGLQVEDLLTGERFTVNFDGEDAAITCPDDSLQAVPSSEVLAYLPDRPSDELCGPRDRPDACQQDADCNDDQLVCCNIGDRNLCLTAEDCADSIPRQICDNNGQCGQDEVCCNLDLVNVCDVALCGDRLCCAVLDADVCATENECNREDNCDPQDLESCEEGQLCCDTELGNRCLDGVGVCPDPEDPIGSSCIANVLECFGTDNELDRCEEQVGIDVTRASYLSGNSALFFTHNGQPAAITADDVDDCYQIVGTEQTGFEIIDRLNGNQYQIEVDGPEAIISCPLSRTSVVPTVELRTYLPVPPEPELCDVAPREDECINNSDCEGDELICCNIGDRNLCLIGDHCQDSLPRDTCEGDEQCGEGTVCCEFSTVRVCDPLICQNDEVCCDVQQQAVCGSEIECEEERGDECDIEDPEGCPGEETCCDGNFGTRCLPLEEGAECPDALVGTCLAVPFVECFGQNPAFQQCILREEPDQTIEVSYVGGARNFFSEEDGAEHRLSGFQDQDCFEALENGFGGWDVLDSETGENILITTNGDQAFITCPDDTTAQAPLAFIQEFLPAQPITDQCISPETQWQTSCLFSVMECSGTDLNQDSCIDYGELVDRTEVDYGGGILGIFSNREGEPIVQTRSDGVDCFEATTVEGGFGIVDLITNDRYPVEIGDDGVARIGCLNGSVDTVDASFVLPYIPERPDLETCDEAPRDDQCQVDNECGDGLVCCDVGEANLCITTDDCFNSVPQVLCQGDDECNEGQFCCTREPTRICDPEVCGDEICCNVESAQVCGTEDECNGIFHLCEFNDPGACEDGSECCLVEPGRRCVEGDVCPEPPDPLADSCIYSTLLCFGRFNEVAQCTDFGDIDVTQVEYQEGQLATFYTSSGSPARRTFFQENFECFDAFEDPEGTSIAVQDLFDGAGYDIVFDGPDAVITCPDDTVETFPRSAVLDYFPARPDAGQCGEPDRDDECVFNEDCDDLVPGFECCDGGDRNLCSAPGTCPQNNAHQTCDVQENCGEGQECCDLGSVRICDPTVCGQDVCCNVFQARVCGSNAECNTFANVCNLDENDCPNSGICCVTNEGSRCFEGIEDQADCPEPPDPFPGSCLFDAFSCSGEAGALQACVDLGDERLSAQYEGGSQVVYFEDGLRRRVSSDGVDCFEAREDNTGFTITDLVGGGQHEIAFVGDVAEVNCSDNTRVNIPRGVVETFLPTSPVIEQCQGPEDGWRGSCLFGLFECFGTDNEFSQCLDYGDLNFTTVDYDTGNAATFFNDRGVAVVRTRDVNQQPCFRAAGDSGTGFEIQDLLTGESYTLELDGDLARITCPDETVDDVLSAFPLAYVTERPNTNQCDEFNRNDQCDVDSDCVDEGFTCCDLGDQNFCVTRESCERSRPRPTCDTDNDCQDGTTCCEFGPSIVCDPDLCGDQPCCSIDQTNVCGSEDDCRGIFNVCEVGDNGSCGQDELCCDTNVGTRCLIGDECPPPPDPLIGSCIFDLFSCFGRLGELDSCVDYGSLDMVEATYDNGGEAVYYNHLGQPARIAGDSQLYCFEALELDGGIRVRDLETDDIYNILIDGNDATIQCPDATTEVVPVAGVLDYLPERPDAQQCEPHEQNVDECQNDADCQDLDPQLACCDTGDRTQCLTDEGCRRNQVRPTCDGDNDCGDGESCCGLLTTRVCNPTICGNALCCDISGGQVCGSNVECNEIVDICEVGNNATCDNGQQCCDSLVGARCVVDDGDPCEPVPDLWEGSCLFETFECFGAGSPLAACFDVGNGGRTEVTYQNGGRTRYFTDEGGTEGRLAGRGVTDCFTAVETDVIGGGFAITDLQNNEESTITFVGDQAQIVCADQTVVNVPRTRVEDYLPTRPNPLACDNAESQWQRSCLFGTFECFGADPEVATCSDHGDIGIREVDYTSGSTGVYFTTLGEDAFRTSSAVDECFQFTTTQDAEVFEVQDLVTGEFFSLRFEDDTVLITCPDEEVQTVLRDNVDDYLPERPDPCDPAERDDECQVDADCGDPQLICCDLGDTNACSTRDGCARSQIREVCNVEIDEDDENQVLLQGTCADGLFCCETSPVRVCDPGRCGGEQICCDFEEGFACGSERDCAGVVDVCDENDPASCAPGSTCCVTDTGFDCVVGDECPPRDNTFESTCLDAVFSCFGPRDFEACSIYDGVDRIDATYSLGGEMIYFTDQGDEAVLAVSNGLPCFTARLRDDGATYEISDANSDDVYSIAIDGPSAIITCPDAEVQPAVTDDLLVFVPDRPDSGLCDTVPRDDECQNDGQCDEGFVCCDTGNTNSCLSVLGCEAATPRPSCLEDTDCNDGTVCCEITAQRVCNPDICGRDQVCCDTDEALVCATELTCAGIIDECDRNDPNSCSGDRNCCATLEGNRCFVGDECPDEPDPVADTCLIGAFECFGRDPELASCVDFGDSVDRTEVTYDLDRTAVFYDHQGQPTVRTRLLDQPCFEAISGDGTLTITDFEDDEVFEIVIDGGLATITCPDEQVNEVALGAILRHIPERPDANACDPAERDDECQTNAECQQLDQTFVCCDVGNTNVCATRESCVTSDPVEVCAEDVDCGEGTICCELETARFCDPTLCGDDRQVCCDVADTLACATEDRCVGIFDRCDINDPNSCIQGELCCPSDQGLECVVGDECPAPPDPVEESCIGSTLSCFGRDNVFQACIDYGDLNRTDVSYEGGTELLFFDRFGEETRRAIFNGLDCYDAVQTEDGFVVQDLLQGDAYTITINEGTATIECPFGEQFQQVPTDALAPWLPARPDANVCDPAVRNDECANTPECGDENLTCCDVGDRNLCLTPESCTRNQPRPFCEDDANCGEDNFCCEMENIRVCDPAVCGVDQACCDVPQGLACGTDRECNGIIDLCVVGDQGSCLQTELCCETEEGNRCLVDTQECPEPPDPIIGTCLEATFGCFGRDNVQTACADWDDNPDRTEVSYESGAEATFFTRRRLSAMRAFSGEDIECFNQFGNEDGSVTIEEIVTEENERLVFSHTVVFDGPNAVITCADAEEFTVPRSSVDAYLPARPDANVCDPAVRDHECNNDGDCQDQGTVCCDTGDRRACLTGEACFENTPRAFCNFDEENPEDPDPSCLQGTVCCEFVSRVCDPVLCGDEVCCTLVDNEDLAVCATDAECQGTFDACQVNDPQSCGVGELCCPGEFGTRCALGNECPDPPDPILETCLVDEFTCFGADNVQDSCVDWGNLDRTDVTYASGSTGLYFTDIGGQPTQRTTNGLVECFDAFTQEDGTIVIQDLLNQETHTIEFLGQEAVIGCDENIELVIPRASVDAYLFPRPDPGDCDEPVRNDECQIDADCEELDPQLRCCDIGDQNTCGNAEACATSVPRRACNPPDPEDPQPQLNESCPDSAPVCCQLGVARVCDPTICGDQVCCNLDPEQDQAVCGTAGECNGIIDFCQLDGDCSNGQSCCPTVDGTRCLIGNECPDEPDPVDESCIGPTLQCYGRDLAQLSCEDFSPLDRTVVAHQDDQSTVFYTHNGDATRRTLLGGGVSCYEAVEVEGGGFSVTNLGTGDVFQVAFEGQTATITCPGDFVEELPTADVLAYLPSRPDPNGCDPTDRNEECQNDQTCQDLDDVLTCCDVGDENICGTGEACALNIPRETCDDDADCGNGTVCCPMDTARVCNPSLCPDGDTCCNLEQPSVCASSAECGGVLDHCELNDPNECGGGNLCCPTNDGTRCLVGDECPEPPDPIVVSCIGATLGCFGTEHVLDECTETGDLGVIDALYLDETRSQFFTHFGREARRTYQADVPCFSSETNEDGSLTITDLLTESVYQVAFDGQTASITCPDDSTEDVPRLGFVEYFPVAPAQNQCVPAPRQDACSNDNECAQQNPSDVCCDTGDGSLCIDARSCQDLTPQALCNNDSECGEGVGCCERETVRVCDPIVCDGQQCCDIENRQVCGGTPEACQLRSSCLFPTLECFGDELEFDQCVVFADTGVIRADYQTGANALYFTTLNQPGRRASFDVLPCFQAIETSDPPGYEILDLQNNESYLVLIDGQDAQVTCSDNQQESVSLAAIQAFLPPAPDENLCGVAERDDECQVDGDCVQFGPDSICCDGGVNNLCLPGGGDCAEFVPQDICVNNTDCPEGTGCCEQTDIRICDPAICGEDICCTAPAINTCSDICLLCDDRSDCEPGQVCCSFTGQCSDPGACEPEPVCDVDADCEGNQECCKTGQTPQCVEPGTCPIPCRSDADCDDNGRICCGDQQEGLGAHCSTPELCDDDNNQLACATNSDCGNGELCCRTLDEPACVSAGSCPVACGDDADCGNGEECCLEEGRTPVCVPDGTCLKRLGESCTNANECTVGLTCCDYATLGDVCMTQEHCGQQVPAQNCEQDPGACLAFPLAACCTVNGVAQCSVRDGCDEPFFTCAQDVDCGITGSECCTDQPLYFCRDFNRSCDEENPF